MSSDLSRQFLLRHRLPNEDRERLLAIARQLRLEWRTETSRCALTGRHIAVAIAPGEDRNASVLAHVAERLGAHVSRVDQDALANTDNPVALARALGRLYDAIDCATLPAELASELEQWAGVPVFAGLGEPGHPVRVLLSELDDHPRDCSSESRRDGLSALLGAVLLEAMG